MSPPSRLRPPALQLSRVHILMRLFKKTASLQILGYSIAVVAARATDWLDDLPLPQDTAERWARDGGPKGGEAEFLSNNWQSSLRETGGVGGHANAHVDDRPDYGHLGYVVRDTRRYLCLYPPPPNTAEALQDSEETTALKIFDLLQPLADKCLYYSAGWMTYEYCHGKGSRQFRALPDDAGALSLDEPREDPEWAHGSRTIGRPPAPAINLGEDVSRAWERAVNATLELAAGSNSRYLVQRWGNGTICEITGEAREVEVQFHCDSTASADAITLVREVKKCSYLLVIHTHRLCGQPGFQPPPDEAHIRCRVITETANSSDNPDEIVREAESPVDGAPLQYHASLSTSDASLVLHEDSSRGIDIQDWRHNYADGDYRVGIIERLLAHGCEMGPNPTYGQNPGDSLLEVMRFEVGKALLADGLDPEEYPAEWPDGDVGLDAVLDVIRDDIIESLYRTSGIELVDWPAGVAPGDGWRLHGENSLIDIYVSEWVQALEHAGIDVHERPAGYARDEL
ncbi:hypothetical protein FIBSPDRAFT_958167 [Athelia psychrophila]|uniref:Protein OS-9 homolog n=1 Tax=Athelia psychrophila TaxID=1759441 RepID=A0A166F010_9AGAM|nr:hypothetical protein FIBSPDRAFT_958167 [Fibularhizoctonia sp. CBS 109695]